MTEMDEAIGGMRREPRETKRLRHKEPGCGEAEQKAGEDLGLAGPPRDLI
jgi:hypothetical protein